jgi:4-hydroxybenzoate polyprenyltransferase
LNARTVLAVAGSLAIVVVAAAWAMSARLGWLMAGYLVIQACYSLWLKHIVILDVMTLASGFVLRVAAGGLAVDIEPSNWLLVTTSLLALFLGFSKRRQEIRHLGIKSSSHRSVLAEYNITFIDQMNAVLTASCILCYALYTIAPETVALYGTERLLLTLPFVVYGLLRYLYLIHVRELGDNPTEVILGDTALQACIVLWVLTFLWIIRFGS